MLLDQQNTFFDNGATTALTGNSDVIDMGAATNLGALRLGLGLGGEGVEVFTKIGTKGNADNTLAYNLVGADDAAFTVNKITVAALAATNIAAGGTHHLPVGFHTPKRYFRLEVTVAGTTPAINGAKMYLHTTANQRSLAGQGLV